MRLALTPGRQPIIVRIVRDKLDVWERLDLLAIAKPPPPEVDFIATAFLQCFH